MKHYAGILVFVISGVDCISYIYIPLDGTYIHTVYIYWMTSKDAILVYIFGQTFQPQGGSINY